MLEFIYIIYFIFVIEEIVAYKTNNISIIKYFLLLNSSEYQTLISIIYQNDIKALKFLLNYKKINPSIYDNLAIRCASENGHIEIVKFLLTYSQVDPTIWESFPIYIASVKGYTEIVKILLKDGRSNVTNRNNASIRWAVYYKHIDIVKLLLLNKVDAKNLNSDDSHIQELLDEWHYSEGSIHSLTSIESFST